MYTMLFRLGQHDEARLDDGAELQIEQQEDDADGDRHHIGEACLGALECLELSRPNQRVAVREVQLPLQQPPGVFNVPPDVSPANIDVHDVVEVGVLGFDDWGTLYTT